MSHGSVLGPVEAHTGQSASCTPGQECDGTGVKQEERLGLGSQAGKRRVAFVASVVIEQKASWKRQRYAFLGPWLGPWHVAVWALTGRRAGLASSAAQRIAHRKAVVDVAGVAEAPSCSAGSWQKL